MSQRQLFWSQPVYYCFLGLRKDFLFVAYDKRLILGLFLGST